MPTTPTKSVIMIRLLLSSHSEGPEEAARPDPSSVTISSLARHRCRKQVDSVVLRFTAEDAVATTADFGAVGVHHIDNWVAADPIAGERDLAPVGRPGCPGGDEHHQPAGHWQIGVQIEQRLDVRQSHCQEIASTVASVYSDLI
jgi:hypothetical protein